MPGAGDQLAPAMPIEQPVDGAVLDLMTDSAFKGLLNLGSRGDFSLGSTSKEGGDKGPFFFSRQILMATTPLPWRFHRSHAQSTVGRNHLMYGCFAHATMFRDVLCLAWIHQSIVDNEPALSTPGSRIIPETIFYLFR